jgi:hypothetical protein
VMMAAPVPKLFYFTAYPTDSFPKKKVDSQNDSKLTGCFSHRTGCSLEFIAVINFGNSILRLIVNIFTSGVLLSFSVLQFPQRV